MVYISSNIRLINKLLCYLTNRYPRLTAVRVDLHYPKIVDNGDNICCFPNLEPGEISRMRDSLRAKLEADRTRKEREGKRTYRCSLFIIWAKEYSESGKCHYHICLLFNKDAYYHLGDYDQHDNLRGMITGAWYSALRLERAITQVWSIFLKTVSTYWIPTVLTSSKTTRRC